MMNTPRKYISCYIYLSYVTKAEEIKTLPDYEKGFSFQEKIFHRRCLIDNGQDIFVTRDNIFF